MNNETTNLSLPNDNDRLLSLLSHLGAMFGGIFLPLIIWATQKDKSQFIRFNSLQALFFQIAYTVVILFISIIYIAIVFITTAGTITSNDPENFAVLNMFMAFGLMAIIFGSIFVFFGYSIYIGIKSYQGEIKKYPIIGNIIYKRVYGG